MVNRAFYFKAVDGSTVGPFDLNTVSGLISRGKVRAKTPVSKDGQHFQPLHTEPELADMLSKEPGLSDSTTNATQPGPTYSGSLTEVSIPKLLFRFCAAKATGRILFSLSEIQKELFLSRGVPVAVTSNRADEQPVAYLIQHGVIDSHSREQWDRYSEEHRLFDQLLQQQLIDTQKLYQLHEDLMRHRTYEIFTWREGTYAFFEGQKNPGDLPPLNLNPWQVIAQGVRTGFTEDELKSLLGAYRNKAIRKRSNPHFNRSELRLLPEEAKIFNSFGNASSLAEILRSHPNQQLVWTVLYLANELEMIAFTDQPEPDSQSAQNDQPSSPDRAHKKTKQSINTNKTKPYDDAADSASPSEEQQLQTLYNELADKNYFERLGIEPSATSAQASKAFIKGARDYHPDHVTGHATKQVTDLKTKIFALLNEAHQVLSDDAKRAEYSQALASGDLEKVDVSKILRAETLFHKGEILLKNMKFAEAKKTFDDAIALNAEEGEFYVYRGYARFCALANNADERTRRQCLSEIQKGLEMREDKLAVGFLFLGRIYNTLGNTQQAEKHYKKVLSLEKGNLEALRELRLLTMRSTKKKGFFRR